MKHKYLYCTLSKHHTHPLYVLPAKAGSPYVDHKRTDINLLRKFSKLRNLYFSHAMSICCGEAVVHGGGGAEAEKAAEIFEVLRFRYDEAEAFV